MNIEEELALIKNTLGTSAKPALGQTIVAPAGASAAAAGSPVAAPASGISPAAGAAGASGGFAAPATPAPPSAGMSPAAGAAGAAGGFPAPATPAPPVTPPAQSYDDIDRLSGLPPAETGLPSAPDYDVGFWDVYGAGWQAETVRTDAWNYEQKVRQDLQDRMWRQLSPDAKQRVREFKWDGQNNWMLFEDIVTKELAAQKQSGFEPAGAYDGLPLSREEFDAQVLEARRTALNDAQAVLDQPGGGFAGFVGMAARSLTDEASLMLLPFGVFGRGGLAVAVAREAALGAAFEAAILPREFEVARELDIADPNAVARIALGATLGGALGGGLHGVGTLIQRTRARTAATRAATPPGVDDIDAAAAVDAAEAQMRGDRTVAETIGGSARGTLGDILVETGTRAKVVVAPGAKRKDPIQPVLEARLSQAVGEVFGPGYTARVYSPGQPSVADLRAAGVAPKDYGKYRTGSTRHNHGKAADVRVFGPDGRQVAGDALGPLAQYWAAKRFGGVGMEMKGGGIHLDIHETPPPGGSMSWDYVGDGGTFTPAQAAAVEAGLRGEMPTLGGQPGPTPTVDLTPTPGLSYNEPAVLDAIIGAESGGRATAQNPNSSALGLGQMTADTWMDLVRRHRPDLMEGLTPSQVLELRVDPALSREMTGHLARASHARLKAEGLNAGPSEIYLAHFLGENGAVRMLNAAPDAPISTILSPRVMAANKAVRYRGKTFAEMNAFDLRQWSRNKMKSAYGEGAPATGAPTFGSGNRGYTGPGQVRVSDDMTIDVTYEVVDISSITRSSGEFQPRDRTGANSDAWIADTAARLDPAQLMPAPTAAMGPPIVGKDGMIESGNGRYGAVERAFDRHPERIAAYRSSIEQAGFAISTGVDRPILIARRQTDLTPKQRQQMTIDAQDSGVAQMTPTEVALAFGRAMDVPILARFNPELALTDAGNGEFVRSLLSALPRSARNAMSTKAGALNRYGQDMLHEAIFARAWNDPDIVSLFIEAMPGDMKGLLDALEKAVPSWAALKSDIEGGLVRPEFDISGHVLDAMRLISSARTAAKREGVTVNGAMDELLNTPDMLAGPVAPLTTALVSKFWKGGRAAPSDKLADFLTRYADDARTAGRPGDMFGDAPTPRDVLRTIDAETFRDLPDDLGPVRGFARKEAPIPPPRPADPIREAAFDAGAGSPAARDVGTTIRADIEAPSAQPVAGKPKAPVGLFEAEIEKAVAGIRASGTADDLADVLKSYEAVQKARAKLNPSDKDFAENVRAGNEKLGAVFQRLKPYILGIPETLTRGQKTEMADLASDLQPTVEWFQAIFNGQRTAANISQSRDFQAFAARVWGDDPAKMPTVAARPAPPGTAPVAAAIPDQIPSAVPPFPARAAAPDALPTMAPTAAAPDALPAAAPDALPPVAPTAAGTDLAQARAEMGQFADFEIKLADGARGRVRDILDDLDDDAGFDAFVHACGLGGAR